MWKGLFGQKKAAAPKTPAAAQVTRPVIPAAPEPEPAPPPAPALPRIQLPGTPVYSGGMDAITVPDALQAGLDADNCLVVSGILEKPVPSSGRTGGLSFQVSDELEMAASGNRIRIHLLASGDTEGTAFLAYSTNEVGNSSWMKFDTGPEERISVFEFNVPVMKQGLGDFIGINPNGHTLVIKSVHVEVLGQP